MGNLIRDSRRVIQNFVNRASQRRYGVRRFSWEPGKNPFRLFPFSHVVNVWDVLRGDLGYTKADIGKVVDLLAIPITRYYANRAINGVSRSYDCPMFRAWCEMPKDERKRRSRERPQDMFIANVMDMRRVSDGINPVLFSGTEWLGERGRDGNRVTYGIAHLVFGYPLGGEGTTFHAEEPEEFEGPADITGLKVFPGYGESILGCKGQDIVVLKRMGRIGKNEVLLLNKEIQGGPIKLLPKKSSKTGEILCVEIPQKLAASVQDLLLLPDCFPGWASDNQPLPHPDYPDLVSKFTQAVEAAGALGHIPTYSELAGGLEDETLVAIDEAAVADAAAVEVAEKVPEVVPENEPLESPTEPQVASEPEPVAPVEEEKPKKKVKRKKPAAKKAAPKKLKLEAGVAVVAVDVEEESGVEIETRYVGTIFDAPKGTSGMVEVTLKPAEQEDERTRDLVERAIQTQKTDVFLFPVGAVQSR